MRPNGDTIDGRAHTHGIQANLRLLAIMKRPTEWHLKVTRRFGAAASSCMCVLVLTELQK